jgi:hypothetical protein
MFQLKIRNLPILDGKEVKGIITMKVLHDSYFNVLDIGGKKGYIHNVTGRRGLPDTAKIDLKKTSSTSTNNNKNNTQYTNMSSMGHSLDIEIGSFALPHPFKRAEFGVAMNHRDYGAFELSQDLSVCEDAHFAIRIQDPLTISSSSSAASSTEISTSPSLLLPVDQKDPSSIVYMEWVHGDNMVLILEVILIGKSHIIYYIYLDTMNNINVDNYYYLLV